MFRTFTASTLLSLGLFAAGCQSTTVDDAIAKNLPRLCSVSASIHTAFVTVAATGEVSASLVRKERAAWTAMMRICNDPASVNSSTALVVAAEAYAAMVSALKEAE